MNNNNEMKPQELADLLEEKAKKLRETNDLSSVVGGDGKESPEGGCVGDCCGSKCFLNSTDCDVARATDDSCKRSCIMKSSN